MKVYLGLGSNVGNRERNLQSAREQLHPQKQSSVYETEPVDFIEQPWFLNQVVVIETNRTPRELLDECKKIEASLKRTREIAKGPRTIDVDILFYGQEVINEPLLTIPHPSIAQRRFVLIPLNEIAPGLRHPVLGFTVNELLVRCEDRSAVHPYKSRSV